MGQSGGQDHPRLTRHGRPHFSPVTAAKARFPNVHSRPEQQRGRLKIYLGYAAGVGKTFQMLLDGQELRSQGVDVVIGYFEPHGRKDTIDKTEGLEIIPRRVIEYRGTKFEEMDTEAILRRHPQVCLVDEFPTPTCPAPNEPSAGR